MLTFDQSRNGGKQMQSIGKFLITTLLVAGCPKLGFTFGHWSSQSKVDSQLRERVPRNFWEKSIFVLICDNEWNQLKGSGSGLGQIFPLFLTTTVEKQQCFVVFLASSLLHVDTPHVQNLGPPCQKGVRETMSGRLQTTKWLIHQPDHKLKSSNWFFKPSPN